MKYLLYKIINIILLWLTRPVTKKDVCKDAPVLLGFNHHMTHLGDRLFYVDFIYSCLRSGKKVYCYTEDYQSFELFNSIGLKVNYLPKECINFLEIIPEHSYTYYFFSKKLCFNYQIFVGYNSSWKNPLCNEVGKYLCDKISLKFYTFIPTMALIPDESQFILFNNYINSGFFRKYFINEGKLIDEIRNVVEPILSTMHVGSSNDKSTDKKTYSFIDIDARGKLDLDNLIKLFREKKIQRVVTYDNVIMHLANLYGVDASVLFRGRFTKAARDFHYRSVNPATSRGKIKMRYL